MADFDDEIRKIATTRLAAEQGPEAYAPRHPRLPHANGGGGMAVAVAGAEEVERYDFDRLGEQIAESLVSAAEEQCKKAAGNLERVREFAEALRSQIATKNKELADMNARLKMFGEAIIEAHQRFK